eukprot:TRINITY_DN75184_c0_g1_i1.p1 TRINITY_DN75184_c0_g1~~TRINITY_DN75184_c0_g1_i1.p1  ORF type:complete len:442 (+),score=88.75 TRINITY_DN75184_c0_g1_i1:78-1403(+)
MAPSRKLAAGLAATSRRRHAWSASSLPAAAVSRLVRPSQPGEAECRRFSTWLKPVAHRATVLKGEGTIETVARVLDLQKQGRDIVRMEVGDPDFDTPAHISDAAVEALRGGATHYDAAGGSLALRETVAEYFRTTRPGLDAKAENVLCMPGGKPVIFHTIAALCQDGDEVIIPDPGFPAYETTIEWSGAKVVPLRLHQETGFRFDHEELRRLISPKTKLIVICSPGNPTGGVLTSADLDAVAAAARSCGAWVISDEIYSQLVFEGEHESIATREGMLERTIVLDGCSKAFAMTGWRVGFGLFPPALVEPARNIGINSWTCLPPFVGAGAIAALKGPQGPTHAMRDEFKARRDLVFNRLNEIPGINIAVLPAGAIYLLADVTGTGLSSREFSNRLLDEHGVSVLDGNYFGAGGEGLVRISFGQSRERLAEGCERIAKFVASL